MFQDFCEELLWPLVIFLIAIIALCVGLSYGQALYEVSTMTKAGYEAKMINMDCVAKYQGRWLSCSAVAKNQIQIVN